MLNVLKDPVSPTKKKGWKDHAVLLRKAKVTFPCKTTCVIRLDIRHLLSNSRLFHNDWLVLCRPTVRVCRGPSPKFGVWIWVWVPNLGDLKHSRETSVARYKRTNSTSAIHSFVLLWLCLSLCFDNALLHTVIYHDVEDCTPETKGRYVETCSISEIRLPCRKATWKVYN